MRSKQWGDRKLTDAVIREIASLSRAAPKGTKEIVYQALALKHRCGASTVGRIANGWVLPKEDLPQGAA